MCNGEEYCVSFDPLDRTRPETLACAIPRQEDMGEIETASRTVLAEAAGAPRTSSFFFFSTAGLWLAYSAVRKHASEFCNLGWLSSTKTNSEYCSPLCCWCCLLLQKWFENALRKLP